MRRRYLRITLRFVAMGGINLMYADADLLWLKVMAFVAFLLVVIDSISLAVNLDRATRDQGDCK